jgi:hypothetical protein
MLELVEVITEKISNSLEGYLDRTLNMIYPLPHLLLKVLPASCLEMGKFGQPIQHIPTATM